MSLTKQELDYNQDGDPIGFNNFPPDPRLASVSARQGYDTWELEKAMSDYLRAYGKEALAEKIDEFMSSKELW